MAKKRIRMFGDPVLREKSSSVKKIDNKTIKLIEDLEDTDRKSVV